MIGGIQRLARRVAGLVELVLIRAVNDAGGVQQVQVVGQDGEPRPDSATLRLEQYGYTSHPLPPSSDGTGCEGVALSLGDGAQSVVIATQDRRYRVAGDLQPGEVCLYDDQGQAVYLSRSNTLTIYTTGTIVLNGGTVKIGGGAGQKIILGDAFRVLFNSHHHPSHGAPPATLMDDSYLSTKGRVE